MNVLVDTSVWSTAFRKGQNSSNTEVVSNLIELIKSNRVVVLGAIRQEILSGISNQKTFQDLKHRMEAFTDLEIESEDFVRAAEFYNRCRSKGIQGSHTDFLICSVAHKFKIPIFTLDNDFSNYSKHIEIKLY